jgi:Zn-finger nucleic acid-binding protein
MKCPHCPETTLVMTDRQGIEIDYCPSCRGVWLDRGELDKLMDRAAAVVAPVAAAIVAQSHAPAQQRQCAYADSDERHHGQHKHQSQGNGYVKKKKSWMSEIFD